MDLRIVTDSEFLSHVTGRVATAETSDFIQTLQIMKIISIRQPWLQVILAEGKDIENRSRPTAYRGWVALHAPAQVAEDDDMPENWTRGDALALDRRAILAVARISDVVTESDSKWFNQERSPNYGLALSDVKALKKPLPYNGGVQGVKQLPEEIAAQLRELFPKLRMD
jgi:hypothetical protein